MFTKSGYKFINYVNSSEDNINWYVWKSCQKMEIWILNLQSGSIYPDMSIPLIIIKFNSLIIYNSGFLIGGS